MAKDVQNYTVEYFSKLKGWEGIYLADMNTKVLAHPVDAVVGKVMREGDALTELRTILENTDTLYNTGIITSPASGELIISMYYPVIVDNKPMGYVGGGVLASETMAIYSDVSSLNMDTAYVYFVSRDGTMLYHPNEEKIGNPVENEAVKGLLAKLEAGEHPEPNVVEYKYKGAFKYAGYYIGANESYI